MQDYIIYHKFIIEKLGISKTTFYVVILIFLFPPFLFYLNAFSLAFPLLIFLGFILFLNIILILPSFIKIKYKLKISSDGIAFYFFAPSKGYAFPRFERHHIQFSDIKDYLIKKHSLLLYYQNNHGLYNAIEKREIKNLNPEECSEISNILLQKIGDKYNSGFKQSLLSWLWQNFHITLLLLILITVCLALLYKFIKNFF